MKKDIVVVAVGLVVWCWLVADVLFLWSRM